MDAGSYSLSVVARGLGLSYTPAGNVAPLRTKVSAGVSQSIAYGTAAGRGDLLVSQRRTLAAGAGETLDLYAAGLTDVFGVAVAFRKLRSVALWVASGGDAAGVTVGAAASNALPLFFGGTTPTWTVYPGGPPLLGGSPAGVTVGTTSRNVKVLNNGAVSVTYQVVLSGARTAAGAAVGVLGLTYPGV